MTENYVVQAQPVGRFWAIDVPTIGNVTQARNVQEIDTMARELIEVTTNSTDFTMDIRLHLPPEVEQHRQRAAQLRAEELRIRGEAASELRAAARVLRDQGLALRDVGALLGVSTARAGQLLATNR